MGDSDQVKLKMKI